VKAIRDSVAEEVKAIKEQSDTLVGHMHYWIENHFLIGYSTDMQVISTPGSPPQAIEFSIAHLFGWDFERATMPGKQLDKGECGAAVQYVVSCSFTSPNRRTSDWMNHHNGQVGNQRTEEAVSSGPRSIP
jgi:hypothetical protein